MGWGSARPTQGTGPRGKSGDARCGHLSNTSGLQIHDMQLPTAGPIRNKDNVPTVRGPGWIFVPALRGQLPDLTTAHEIYEELGGAFHHPVKHDRGTIR